MNSTEIIAGIQKEIESNGIVPGSITPMLKELREIALTDENPRLVRVLRLTYEHIEENDAFLIPIPQDEAIDEETGEVIASDEPQDELEGNLDLQKESLLYLVALTSDPLNKSNFAELKDYIDAFMNF